MEGETASIYLRGMESYITQTEHCAFLVRSGTVYVYIVPWTDHTAGRRVLLCECAAGSVIPALVFCDRNYQQWRFSFVAHEEAELRPMPNSVTSVLLRRFSQRAGLSSYPEEGFENSIVEYYRREEIKDSVFIERGKKQEPVVKNETYSVIQDALVEEKARVRGDSLWYKAVAFLCRRLGQAPVPEADIPASGPAAGTVPAYARAMKLICRQVALEDGWHQKDCGCLIVTKAGKPYACFHGGLRGYQCYDPETEKTQKLSRSFAGDVEPQAFYLGKTLPEGALKAKDMFRFMASAYEKSDLCLTILLGFVSALVGLLLPTLSRKVFDDYIPLGSIRELTQLCIVTAAFLAGNLFFLIVKDLSGSRIQSRIGYALQDAAYYRLFRLPDSFFRTYESADLAQRLSEIGPTANVVVRCTVLSTLSVLFSGLYLICMFRYSPRLARLSVLIIALYAAARVLIAKRVERYDRTEAEERGKASAKLYQYLRGIAKIRMAGAEDRAALDYIRPFSAVQAMQVQKSRFSAASLALTGVLPAIISLVLYGAAVQARPDLSVGSLIGFQIALGLFAGAVLNLIDDLLAVSAMRPRFKRIQPIFACPSETGGNYEQPGPLSGEIELEHVTFSYPSGQRPVIDDLSLRVKPGEYLGIVGPSGCGKSTLLKLLLGFEKPDSGQVLYDGKDLASFDKQAFRQNLGVVLQHGKLISGSIFENITMTAPDATVSDVQRVLAAVGLAEDVARMPMGVHTVLNENAGTISRGQQQRILIARAILQNPSILIFDEATSALDNLTQAIVCESLDKMKATRIVAAHRLSTIRGCNRIVVLSEGKIAEEGNYDALMARRGLFYRLASRQITE